MKYESAGGFRLEAKICVQSIPLKEYRHPEKASHKYVQSIENANFDVRLEVATPHNLPRSWPEHDGELGIAMCVFMDGRLVVALWEPACPSENVSFFVDGITRNCREAFTKEKFIFATLETDDARAEDLSSVDYRRLGDIKVHCHVAVAKGVEVPHADVPAFKRWSDVTTVPEELLKGRAISNQVSVSEPQPLDFTNPSALFNTVASIAKLTFQYRTKRDLEIDGIISPPTPTPSQKDEALPSSAEGLRRSDEEEQNRGGQGGTGLRREKRGVAAAELDEGSDESDGIVVDRNKKRSKRARNSTV